jgi:uncharacterized protein YjbI with pentapeptide repeats
MSMVMSGGGDDDPRETSDEESVPLDWSFQNHSDVILRKGRHAGSTFRRAILDNADFTEGDFSNSDFRKASMFQIDLMKSAFDGSDLSTMI